MGAHFFFRRRAIIETCRQWVEEAKEQDFGEVSYEEIVARHNPGLASKFAAAPGAYHAAISSAVGELTKLLLGLQKPSTDEDDDAASEKSDSDSDGVSDSDSSDEGEGD